LSPLLKRLSFKHEEEVRAFFLPKCEHWELDSFKPEAISLGVDVNELVQGIYVSPYADASFLSAVRLIANKFGLADRLVHSTILESADQLYAGILGQLDNA